MPFVHKQNSGFIHDFVVPSKTSMCKGKIT